MIGEALLTTYVVAHLALALFVSYETKGGAEGQTPVLVHAVGIPLVAWPSLGVLDILAREWSLPIWGYVAGFPASVVLVGWLICKAGDVGEAVERRRTARYRSEPRPQLRDDG